MDGGAWHCKYINVNIQAYNDTKNKVKNEHNAHIVNKKTTISNAVCLRVQQRLKQSGPSVVVRGPDQTPHIWHNLLHFCSWFHPTVNTFRHLCWNHVADTFHAWMATDNQTDKVKDSQYYTACPRLLANINSVIRCTRRHDHVKCSRYLQRRNCKFMLRGQNWTYLSKHVAQWSAAGNTIFVQIWNKHYRHTSQELMYCHVSTDGLGNFQTPGKINLINMTE